MATREEIIEQADEAFYSAIDRAKSDWRTAIEQANEAYQEARERARKAQLEATKQLSQGAPGKGVRA